VSEPHEGLWWNWHTLSNGELSLVNNVNSFELGVIISSDHYTIFIYLSFLVANFAIFSPYIIYLFLSSTGKLSSIVGWSKVLFNWILFLCRKPISFIWKFIAWVIFLVSLSRILVPHPQQINYFHIFFFIWTPSSPRSQ